MSTLLFVALTVLLSLPVYLLLAVLVLQAAAACLPRRTDHPAHAGRTPSFVVLMPAHDEESIIAHHVGATLAAMGGQGRLLVIADNCTDATASEARSAGAEVMERLDPTRRGKGYALAFGLQQLEHSPPEVVVVLDADCMASGDAITRLAQAAHGLQRPIQGQYDMLAPEGSPMRLRMAAFAWDFRGRFRAHGFLRLGLPSQLMGSGMAFPWPVVSRVDLATGHLVEDLKLGLDCARKGAAPLLLPSAVVSSTFPTNEAGAQSQRVRWEHGHLGMVASSAPQLLAEGFRTRNPDLLAMTFDMCVPPLALFSLLVTLNALLMTVLAWTGAATDAAAILALAGLALLVVVVMVGWWRVGRRWIGLMELATVPWYVLRKLPVYAGFVFRRQAQWIRTRRD